MPVKEEWGVLVREDSPLTNKECISPQDLVGIPLILPLGDFTQSNIGKWFGKYASQIEIIAKGNLLYNEAMMAAKQYRCGNRHQIALQLRRVTVYSF